MHKSVKRVTLAIAAMAIAAIAPAAAQSFQAEVDCGGIFSPGDSVPYTLRLENQTLDSIPLSVSVKVSVPGMGDVSLGSGSVTLGPNQDLSKSRTLVLPQTAPIANDYRITFTASSADETAFDTCSFKVQ